jgi:hypothetical protein
MSERNEDGRFVCEVFLVKRFPDANYGVGQKMET